jgi:hypothetical protein
LHCRAELSAHRPSQAALCADAAVHDNNSKIAINNLRGMLLHPHEISSKMLG